METTNINTTGKISIINKSITSIPADIIVNAANDGLWHGSGVCGAIFEAAGAKELTAACNEIGHCDTGSAVITPAFKLPAKYIVHAVGPVWHGGNKGEPKQLYGAYTASLLLAKEHSCHSIVFPLISAGIFGYPKDKAWREAIKACRNFIEMNPEYDIDIKFAVLSDEIVEIGKRVLAE